VLFFQSLLPFFPAIFQLLVASPDAIAAMDSARSINLPKSHYPLITVHYILTLSRTLVSGFLLSSFSLGSSRWWSYLPHTFVCRSPSISDSNLGFGRKFEWSSGQQSTGQSPSTTSNSITPTTGSRSYYPVSLVLNCFCYLDQRTFLFPSSSIILLRAGGLNCSCLNPQRLYLLFHHPSSIIHRQTFFFFIFFLLRFCFLGSSFSHVLRLLAVEPNQPSALSLYSSL
jgi:hypothetical protein